VKEAGKVVQREMNFEKLETIPFNSDRKRMSQLIRFPQEMGGMVKVMMKGADNFIIDRLTPEHKASEALKVTNENIEQMGNDGLRTLLYSVKEVHPGQYQEWSSKWAQAMLIPDKATQDKRMAELAPEMEEGHEPLGASAIEDKLQDKVGETITHLSEAGIQTWVLTGDKTNTAIMIGYACCLLTKAMEVYTIKQDKQGPSVDGDSNSPIRGQRVMDLILKADAYFRTGTKRCPMTESLVKNCEDWYRIPPNPKDKEDEDSANVEAGHDHICKAAYDNMSTEEQAPYIIFRPMDVVKSGNLAMVIEGTALSQIGIGGVYTIPTHPRP